jgi:hypothetical protein
MSASLVCVDPARVGELWPHVAAYIRRAMQRGQGDFAGTERDVLAGRALLWLAHVEHHVLAAAVTQIAEDHAGKLCNLVACGGHDWDRFGHLIGGIEKYARDEGCQAVEITGRKGWSRRLRDFSVKHVTLRKELS